jgi:2-haloalkanoic acid dehalogenase type II
LGIAEVMNVDMGKIKKTLLNQRFGLNSLHRAIVFDLDDTLIDYRGRHLNALQYIATLLENRYPSGPPANRWVQEFFRYDTNYQSIWIGQMEKDQESFQRYRFCYALNNFRLIENEAQVDSIYQLYRKQMISHAILEPGILQLLCELRDYYQLGLITNGSADFQLPILRSTGLDKGIFDPVLCGDQVGVYKPNPAIYMIMLNYLELEPREVVMVGDNYKHDIEGAAKLGIDTIWVNTRKEDTQGRDVAGIVVDHVLGVNKIFLS